MLTFNTQVNRRLFIASVVMLVLSLVLSMANMAAVISAPLRANTTVPATVGFEGFLAQANGAPIANGAYTLTFRAYDVPTAGTPLWTEQLTNVQVTNGLYSVVLGATMPFNANTFNGNRWIGVTVGNGTEIAPRTQVSAVPFALTAANTSRIGGGGTANLVAMFDGPCPEGWTEYTAAQGRYVVGVPVNGALGATVGIALSDRENRPVGQHAHTINDPGHSHAVNAYNNVFDGGYWGHAGTLNTAWQATTTDSKTTGIAINNTGTVTGTNAPYIQLRYCKLNQ